MSEAIRKLLERPTWPEGVEARKTYERAGDMGEDGALRVLVDEQGDVYVGTHLRHTHRFCTKVGGGRSPRTRAALLILAEAIRLDNEER